jgi:D-aminoacyl-tRNA deacylase
MKAVVQRVARARVRVDGEEIASIGAGMLVLVGMMKGDSEDEAEKLARKIARFRFFPDDAGKMNRSAIDVRASCLVVSQFTLAADGRAGNRPSFDAAAEPALAEPLYERFVDAFRATGVDVRTGRFGARMEVELVNDGPVTFALEERPSAS